MKEYTKEEIENIAIVCHEANRGYQIANPIEGIPTAPPWIFFDEAQQAGVKQGVRKALEGATPKQLHESWLKFKTDAGWKYGEQKDEVAKTHPCMVPYEELSEDNRIKDDLFSAIVKVLSKK